MARRQQGTPRQIRDEAKHQLRGFSREPAHRSRSGGGLEHQLRGFGSEANYQLNPKPLAKGIGEGG